MVTPIGEERLRAALCEAEAGLREQAWSELVAPRLALLRGGNRARWNDAGWYTVRSDAAGEFTVPADCAAWFALEHDGRNGAAFRFFARAAWLMLAAPRGPARLRLTVPHAVLPQALARLRLTLNGAAAAYDCAPAADACCALTLAIDSRTAARARAEGALRLGLSTPVAAIPAQLHAGSSDRRLLSLAITHPTLVPCAHEDE